MGKDGDTGTRWVENQNFGETQNFSDPKFVRPKKIFRVLKKKISMKSFQNF